MRLILGNSSSITSALKLSVGILEGSRMSIVAIVSIESWLSTYVIMTTLLHQRIY